MYRVCLVVVVLLSVGLSLAPAQPAPPAALELRNLSARSVWQEAGGQFEVQLRFISNVPAVGAAQAGGQSAGPETYACNNHRLDLVGLSGSQPVVVKLTVTPLQGEKLEKTLSVAPPTPYPAVRAGRVELTVTEPAGVDRLALPVTGGVPLAKGALYRADNVRLLAGGVTLPLQSRAEARWEDGSIKWLLLDTQLDLKARAVAKLVLEYGGSAAAKTATGLKLTALPAGGVVADTGALRAVVPLAGETELRLPAGDQLLTKLDGTLTDKDGMVWRFTPEAVKVVESGALRAIVRVDGHYRNAAQRHFLGALLLTLYADKPYARADVVFGNDLVDVVMNWSCKRLPEPSRAHSREVP